MFLGWDAPLLTSATGALIEKFASGSSSDEAWDFSNLLCVLPTARSANRLSKLLSDSASSSQTDFQPPLIITVGELPEHLYETSVPAALEFEQTLAWASVMRDADPAGMSALLPNLPPAQPIAPWLELAGTIRRLHEDLASSNLTFHDVRENAETESESRRWRMLAHLSDRYAEALQQVGLIDPDLARAESIAQKRCRCERTVVLIGTSDISDMLLSMIDGLDGDVIAMVAAPKTEAARFDRFGCVKTDAWLNHLLPIADDNLLPAGDISDQAIAAVQSVRSLGGECPVIGVTDQSQVGPVEMELRGAGHPTFRSLGWTVSSTSVGRLFDLTAAHLQAGTWQSLAALVRHATTGGLITDQLKTDGASAWLKEVDGLLANHYPRKLSGKLPPVAIKNYPLAVQVGEWAEQWLSVFELKDQPLRQWCGVISKWLQTSFAKIDAAQNPRTSMALNAADKLLSRFASLNDGLDVQVPGGLGGRDDGRPVG